MPKKTGNNQQTTATAQALLVTFLWSISWVLIKLGLKDIPALTFAGLRYFVAFLILLPIYMRSKSTVPIKTITRQQWVWLLGLGALYYSLTQGSQFIGLVYLPAITFSLLINFTAPMVAVLGIAFLNEKLSRTQWLGIGVFLVGALLYFYPVLIPSGMAFGFLIAGLHVLATSASSIAGRFINRMGELDALTVTVWSMGIGSTILLFVGIAIEGVPVLDARSWLLVIWLAAVNTAFAFTLWNHTMRTLTATQSSMINNMMLIQIAVLAWFFLGEEISLQEGAGMAIAVLGVALVNLKRGDA